MIAATVIFPLAFFLRDPKVHPLLGAAGFAAVVACAGCSAQAREISLSIGDLQSPGFSAQSVRARLSGARLQSLALEIDRLSVAGRTWHKARLACAHVELTQGRIVCGRGILDVGEKIPIAFSYLTSRQELEVELKPSADETWRMSGRFDAKPAVVEVRVERARLDRIVSWLPAVTPTIRGGRANGTLTMRGETVKARMDVEGLAFADASGLHAGEKIAATLEVDATGKGHDWRWFARLTWRGGEVFWQPVFVAAKGHRLEIHATTAAGMTQVRAGQLELPDIGTVSFKLQWSHAKAAFSEFEARVERARVSALYDHLLKSVLQGTALSDLRADGEVSFAITGTGAMLSGFKLDLINVSFEDRLRRFAVFGLSGHVPWLHEGATEGELDIKGAELLKVPLGAARVPLRVRGTRVDIASLRVPVFDGAVQLRDFAAGLASDGWRWRFSGEVAPISMVQLADAFGLPLMHGSLSGAIPELRYRRGTLAMDGELMIRVFDGLVSAANLQLIEPFGRTPRLHADVEVRNLNLELLTRTFDFGTITGRVDARITSLELVNWQPVRFDARIQSSPGSYPRKISQRAVQNISALGGAGAAAAIQRSLLRFFDEFGYERLGLSCRLENGVCEMGGIERAPQGYVIVKGGGIPAISVIGYNRSVNWRELVERLKRVTQDNVKPIVE